jgi:hypothetical protein
MGVRVFIGMPGVLQFLVVLADEMGENLGVGFRFELVAFGGKFVAEVVVVLNDPIVDDPDTAGLIEMGVRIFIGWKTVRGPTSVTYSDSSSDGIFLVQRSKALRNITLSLADSDFAILHDCDPGAVVAAILKATKAFNDDGRGLLIPDVAENSAHV